MFLLVVPLLLCILYIILLNRDIRQLRRTLQMIERKRTNLRLTTTTSNKELRELAVAVNEMLEENQSRVRESERSSRELRQGITNFSHDLRTPLTSALGYLQLLQSNPLSEGKRQDYVKIVQNRLTSLNGLMKDLFDYTQLVEERVTPKLETINLTSLLQNQIANFYGEFQDKDLRVKLDEVTTIGDVQMMERILQNLLKNMVLHGAEVFEIKLEPGKMVFANSIPTGANLEIERLFERFYTTDSARTGKGTGLGLPIVRELAGLQGKRVDAKLVGERLIVEVSI